jgi:hypothetical protein
VGHRLRINSSKTKYFEESVEESAKAFNKYGYNYQGKRKKTYEV